MVCWRKEYDLLAWRDTLVQLSLDRPKHLTKGWLKSWVGSLVSVLDMGLPLCNDVLWVHWSGETSGTSEVSPGSIEEAPLGRGIVGGGSVRSTTGRVPLGIWVCPGLTVWDYCFWGGEESCGGIDATGRLSMFVC